MELTSKTVELRKLTASEGMYLTQVDSTIENRTYAKSVYLGQGENVENWREADEAEKQAYMAERERRAKEAQEKQLASIANELDK